MVETAAGPVPDADGTASNAVVPREIVPGRRHKGMHAMRVCIVGAPGKLGQYMVQQALDGGYEVVAYAGLLEPRGRAGARQT